MVIIIFLSRDVSIEDVKEDIVTTALTFSSEQVVVHFVAWHILQDVVIKIHVFVFMVANDYVIRYDNLLQVVVDDEISISWKLDLVIPTDHEVYLEVISVVVQIELGYEHIYG